MRRDAMLQTLARDTFDLLIVGGGITGAGVAREASLRGLRVGLVEAEDFAGGTSSRSTKLIHGGLRYLKNMDFRLVKEAVQERMHLLHMAPHLVKVVPFIFPVYKGDPDSLFMLRIGLTLYDWYAGKGNPIPHRVLRPRDLLAEEPTLAEPNLTGGAVYCDAATDDARLTFEVIEAAVSYGATVANYAVVTGFLTDPSGKINGAKVKDKLTGDPFEVKAQHVLVCGGPWADRIRRLSDPNAPELLRATKGVHLTLPAEKLPIKHAVVMRGKDGRMMFAVPSGPFSYVGTTDTDYQGDPRAVTVERADVEYILDATRRLFPQHPVYGDDVTSAWAGLRPLIKPQKNESASATSRDYKLYHEASGLVVVAGGKLTAFRHMASHIVDEVFPATAGGGYFEKSLTPLPGAKSAVMAASEVQKWAGETGAPAPFVAALANRYGSNFGRVIAELPSADLGLKPELRWLMAQVRSAVKYEMAVRLEDVLARRSNAQLFLAGNAFAEADALGQEMGRLLGWSTDQFIEETSHYKSTVSKMFAWRS